jgi:hypothetical protein
MITSKHVVVMTNFNVFFRILRVHDVVSGDCDNLLFFSKVSRHGINWHIIWNIDVTKVYEFT